MSYFFVQNFNLTCDVFLRKEKNEQQMFWCINSYLTSRPPHVQVLLKKERQLFTRRYFSLFKLPAVMSLIQPHHHLIESIFEPNVVAAPVSKPQNLFISLSKFFFYRECMERKTTLPLQQPN